MGIENVDSVLERLGSTEGTTLAINREDDGKFQVTSMLWEAPKVILKDELLEIRNVYGRLHVARKVRHPTNGTRRSRIRALV